MNRKEIARETLDIMEKGYYETQHKSIEIKALQEHSVKESFLLTPEQGRILLEQYDKPCPKSNTASPSPKTVVRVWNCSTVDAIPKLSQELPRELPEESTKDHCHEELHPHAQSGIPGQEPWGKANPNPLLQPKAGAAKDISACVPSPRGSSPIAVLNFASAKNPGGGFINGAMAQEESLAASSCLYNTLVAHETYYKNNRACNTMMYTNHAIYSPDVVFFRDGSFRLLEKPVTASVLTLPAVNMGQVLLKGEDAALAKQAMRERMKLALAIFASQKCSHLILGAYGCGVFRNDPNEVAAWWQELLENHFPDIFRTVIFAVLDKSVSQSCIMPFQDIFSRNTFSRCN